jgi:NAD(P)H-dependent FMN reductase
MKITIVSGSHRSASQSEKIGRYIESVFQSNHDRVEAFLYSLADNPLPLWEESIWESDETWAERLAPMKKQLDESDAFVIISPEWHGQVPAGLKNFFLMFNRFELGHKPALIVTVSSATGGTYPVAELRMNSTKNNRMCYIPEQVIIRNVEQVFNDEAENNDQEADGYYKARLNWCLEMLIGYGDALKAMRASTNIHHGEFGNGM